MAAEARPYRSVLYIPGSKARALDKARSLPADAIIFDLEDAVAPAEKAPARLALREALDQGGYGSRARLVRINGLDSEWGAADVAAMDGAAIDGLLVPKVNGVAEVQAIADLAPGLPVWAMMETARGVMNAGAIADHPAMAGFIIGTNDLAKELTSRTRAAMLVSLQTCLLAARAAAIACIDGVYNAFQDEVGLRAECEEGRDLGFDGKTLIHPSQIATANAVFAPSAADIDLARRQIAIFDEAERSGQGVAVLDGRIVESLHVVSARATLAKAQAIAAREAEE